MTNISSKTKDQLHLEIERLNKKLVDAEQLEKKLKDINKQFLASEQQLKAANQQLEHSSQNALQKSENDLRALFNAMTDIVFEMDYDGKYLNIAPTSPELMFKPSESTLGKKLHDVFPKEEADFFLKFVRDCLDSDKSIKIEYPLIIGDKTSWFEGTGTPKTKNSILYIARDITERKQIEKSLSDKTIMLDNILQSSVDMAIATTDLNFRITYFNPLAEKFFGYLAEDVVGKTVHEIHVMHNVENERLEKAIQIVQEAGQYLYSVKQKTENGVRHLSSRVTGIYNSQNEIIGYVLFSTDVTNRIKMEEERKAFNNQLKSTNQQLLASEQQLRASNQQLIASDESIRISEERYRKIFDYAPIGILIIDKEGNPTSGNKQILEILGSPSIDDTKKINILEYQSLIDIGFSRDFKKCINSGEVIKNESFYKSIWNKKIYIKYIIAPIFGKANTISAVQVIFEDVSVRKNAEEKLNTEREKLLAILDGIDDVMYVADPNTYEILHLNDTAKRLVGENSLGKKCHKVFQNIDVPCSFCTNDIIFGEKLGKTHFWEHYSSTQNRWYRCADKAIEWENGKMVRFELATDISVLKNAEVQLTTSEKRYHQLYENAPDMFFLVKDDGIVISVNEFGAKNLGYTKEELIGHSVWKVVYKEDLAFVQNQINTAIKNKKEKSELEFRKISKEGSIVYVQEKLQFNYKDNETEIQIICRDVTNQRREEKIKKVIYNISNAVLSTSCLEEYLEIIKEELSSIIDTTNFYIALFDETTNSFSLPFYKNEKEELTSFPAGKSLTNYIVKNKKSLLVTKDVKEELVNSGEIELLGVDAKIWLGVPLIVKGKVLGALAVQSYEDENAYDVFDLEMLEVISRHISVSMERKRNESDLQEALTKALESDRLKSAFLLNMSHEIRTPMNGILGFLSLLDDPTYSLSERKEFSAIINKSSDRLLNTITDLISISKIESGQMTVSKKETSVNKILEELLSTFIPEANISKLTISSLPTLSDEAAIIYTDEGKLLNILSNLIKNAIKYTEKGGVSFGYNLKGDLIEFFVKDSGIGVPKDRQNAIFNRFVQADIEDLKAFEGSGLGLAIAKAYVEMLDGEIWLISEENVGSEFKFVLPYNNTKKENIKNSTNLNLKENKKTLPNLSVLVVEDEEISSKYFNSILKNKFKEVIYVKNGKEAVELCKSNSNIDIILMDIKMPIMNGYEATKEIRKFNKDVLIIAQTAYALEGDREKSLEAGCDEYVSKPINRAKLNEIIKKSFGDRWEFQ